MAAARANLAPSFKGLSAASQATSYVKKMTPRSDTTHERLLRGLLWRRGFRFRKNVTTLPGKPDIAFPKERVAVFCDGDFWHGRDWPRLSRKLRSGANPDYWISKIKANRSRDRRTVRLLEKEGWTVIRIWEKAIHEGPELAADGIERVLHARQRGHNAVH